MERHILNIMMNNYLVFQDLLVCNFLPLLLRVEKRNYLSVFKCVTSFRGGCESSFAVLTVPDFFKVVVKIDKNIEKFSLITLFFNAVKS